MATSERRKGEREECSSRSNEVIEIEHSYGRHKRSAYEIVDRSEHGLSFLIPFEEGYFLPGTPLRFFVIRQDSFKTRHVGVTVYSRDLYREDGRRFYHIGLELRSTLRDHPRQKYVLRPPRHTPLPHVDSRVTFRFDGREYSFPVVDLSRFSASFVCPSQDLLLLGASSLLTDVRIRSGKEVLFKGEATVVKFYTHKGRQHRIVVEPRRSLIDTGRLDVLDRSVSASDGTRILIRRHDRFEEIDSTFKAMVADLRFFLEDFRQYLRGPLFKTERREPATLLREIFPLFKEKMDRKVCRIDSYTRKLGMDEELSRISKQYYQKNLLPLFAAAPYNHRVYFKPKGYPGDFEMMRLVHSNRFEGSSLFGKVMNKYSTGIPIAGSVRERTVFFMQRIRAAMEANRTLRVLSVASGPALEFDLLLRQSPEVTGGASVTLLDQEIEALQFSMENLYAHRLRAGSSMGIRFIHQGLGNFIRDIARKRITSRYDFIYASGLFDYFDDKTSTSVIRRLLTLLDPGGSLMIANLSLDGHEHRVFMEYGHDWNLIYRSDDDMSRLVKWPGAPERWSVTSLRPGILKILEVGL